MTEATILADRPAARVPVQRPQHDAAITALAIFLIVLHAGIAWWGRTPGIATRQDDATYVILAQSLRQGGYNELFRADAPVHNQYPPGYPAVLALWGLPFGDSYDGLVLFSLLASVGALTLTFLSIRRVATDRIALLTLLPLAVNPEMVRYAGEISSEAPYLLFSMLGVYLLTRAEHTSRGLGAAAAVAIFATLVRSVGITLLAVVMLHALIERRWKTAALTALAAALTIGAWTAWTIVSPEKIVGKSYVADVVAVASQSSIGDILIGRFKSAVPFYFTRALPWTLALPTIPGTIVDNLVMLCVTAGGLVSGMIVMARRFRAGVLYVLAYAVLLYLYTWVADRFLIPILPLVLPLILIGLATISGRIRKSFAIPAALAFAILVTAGGASRTAELVAIRSACEHDGMRPPVACLRFDQISFFAALDYIRNNTPPDTRILTLKPEALYLNTGRRAVSAPRALQESSADFLTHLRAQGTNYVLLGSLQSSEPRRLPTRMLADCEDYAVERFIPPRTYLFRVRREGELPGSDGCHALLDFLVANRNRDFENDP